MADVKKKAPEKAGVKAAVGDERKKALEAALQQIEKNYGKGAVMRGTSYKEKARGLERTHLYRKLKLLNLEIPRLGSDLHKHTPLKDTLAHDSTPDPDHF